MGLYIVLWSIRERSFSVQEDTKILDLWYIFVDQHLYLTVQYFVRQFYDVTRDSSEFRRVFRIQGYYVLL